MYLQAKKTMKHTVHVHVATVLLPLWRMVDIQICHCLLFTFNN